jgi:hypothetical protein
MSWKGEDRYFTGHYRAASEATNALACAAMEDADRERRRRSVNPRALQARHRETFEVTIEAVVLELLALDLDTETHHRGLAVSRSRGMLGMADDLASPALNATLPDRLDELEATGWLTQKIGARNHRGARLTSILPGPRLVTLAKKLGVTLSDITEDRPAATVVIKDDKDQTLTGRPRRALLKTPRGEQIVDDLGVINRFLEGADIDLRTEQGWTPLRQRRLYRAFMTSSLDHGGRFFGGEWINMKGEERPHRLRINGRRIVKLDYKSMHPRIAYALADAQPPQEDVYHLPSLPHLSREGVKRVLTAMLWDTKERSRFPRETRQHFPRALSFQALRAAILEDHRAIAGYLEAGWGSRLMNYEAEVMNLALVTAAKADLAVLPIHDALLCAQGDESEALGIMERAFKEVTGGDAVVDVERYPAPDGAA